ncbi:phage terminase large subunit [Staphylococcus xylosus]
MNLSKEQLREIKIQAQTELARRYYSDYLAYVHHGNYSHFKHTKLICEYLQKIADGEQLNILIEMPPRHGKSMTVTESFPSYYLGKNPGKRVIATAYSDGLAEKFGRLNRNKFEEFSKSLFDLELSSDKNAAKNWCVSNHIGGMISTGIGGSITGEGADLLIIDDPIKNNESAQSITLRNKIWDEWETTLSTRLHDGASVIAIQTRWHEDDFIGRLLNKSPRKWIRLRLPAIAEDVDDLLNRKIGEPLCPELGFHSEWAQQKKKEVGSKTWASLFQQRPAPSEGNIFNRKWWQYYKELPYGITGLTISWDLTFKDADSSDFVVGQVWGRKGADKYLIDQVRDKMDFPTTISAVKSLSKKYPNARTKLIEDKANGPAVIATLKREISGIIPVNPEGGKVVRAQAVTPMIESGNVYLPENKSFTQDLIEECASFPNGKNDDMVDAMTQALNHMESKSGGFAINKTMW